MKQNFKLRPLIYISSRPELLKDGESKTDSIEMEIMHDHDSYFVSTVVGAPLNIIKQYIEDQKKSERRKKP